LASKLERGVVATDLASYLGVDSGLVLEHFRKMAADRVDRGPAPKAQPTTHATDRILMPLLLSDAEVRAALVTALRGVSLSGAAAPIYETLIGMHETGEAISFVSVHERLGKAQRTLFEAIVLEAANCENTLEDGLACIEAWKRESQNEAQRDLKARIKQAEREGRFEEALRLMALLSQNGIKS
jgi:hypothetical protein